MKREPGYYWVKAKGEWHICYFYAADFKGNPLNIWKFINHNQVYIDSDLEEINESRILSPDELAAASELKVQDKPNWGDLLRDETQNP